MTDDLRQRIADAFYDTYGQQNRDRSRAIAEASLAAVQPELDELLHYRNAIVWETSCLSCSRILDNARAREEELERNIDYLKRNIRRSRDQVDGYDQDLAAAKAAIDRARALHRPVKHLGRTICVDCSAWDGKGSTDNSPVDYDQCATIRALDGPAEQPLCAECGHPQDEHEDADEPVSVGLCKTCDAKGSDDAWHDYEPEEA
ncbi:hypothetical protein [Streptomyces sp. NPDC048516]|uniref:hypothetical protein n=1 Tax=Streptomyces sp. NPDC048516 TaxID=3365565 RepID=UPI0037151A49